MILNMDRERLHAWIKTWALWHGPALQHAAKFESEIVVKMTRRMLLNDIESTMCRQIISCRLVRPLKISLTTVFFQAHGKLNFFNRCRLD